jgi:hypothetical protein
MGSRRFETASMDMSTAAETGQPDTSETEILEDPSEREAELQETLSMLRNHQVRTGKKRRWF